MDCRSRTGPLTTTCLVLVCLLASQNLQAADTPLPVVDQNEELPQGLAIVPWQKSPGLEVEDGPLRLVDEPLEVIDPESFRQRLEYHAQDD